MCELCEASGLERRCLECRGFDVDSLYEGPAIWSRLCGGCAVAFRERHGVDVDNLLQDAFYWTTHRRKRRNVKRVALGVSAEGLTGVDDGEELAQTRAAESGAL